MLFTTGTAVPVKGAPAGSTPTCLIQESNLAHSRASTGRTPTSAYEACVPPGLVTVPGPACETPPGPEAGGLPMSPMTIEVAKGPVSDHRRVDVPASTDTEQSPGSYVPRRGIEPRPPVCETGALPMS